MAKNKADHESGLKAVGEMFAALMALDLRDDAAIYGFVETHLPKQWDTVDGRPTVHPDHYRTSLAAGRTVIYAAFRFMHLGDFEHIIKTAAAAILAVERSDHNARGTNVNERRKALMRAINSAKFFFELGTPSEGAERLIEWIKPLAPEFRKKPPPVDVVAKLLRRMRPVYLPGAKNLLYSPRKNRKNSEGLSVEYVAAALSLESGAFGDDDKAVGISDAEKIKSIKEIYDALRSAKKKRSSSSS